MKAILRFTSCVIAITSMNILAADLVQFSNGDVADADEINANFNELADRIGALADGVAAPAAKINFSKYSHAYKKKTFSINAGDGTKTNETWNFSDDGSVITVTITPVSSPSIVANKTVNTTKVLPNGNVLLVQSESTPGHLLGGIPWGSFVRLPLGIKATFEPGIIISMNEMTLGMPFNSSGAVKLSVSNTSRPGGYFIDTSTPLAIESVIAGGNEYNDCLKIENRRSSRVQGETIFHKVSWYCPGEGLVKEIRIANDVTARFDFANYDVVSSLIIRNELAELIAKEVR